MGGYGSSRWGWYSRKDTVEECRSLDAARWQREGILAPDLVQLGGWSWSDAHTGKQQASIGYEVRTAGIDGRLRLFYTVTIAGEPQKVDYTIPLVTTRPNYGGLRWWFVCPGKGCGRRVRKVYMAPRSRYFLCRQCQDLTYRSAQDHNKARDRFRRMDPEMLLALMQGDGPSDRDRIRAAVEILDRDTRWLSDLRGRGSAKSPGGKPGP